MMKSSLRVALFIPGLSFFFLLPLYAQPASSPWPMFHRDMRHTGLSPIMGPQTGTLAWRGGLSLTYSSPIIGPNGRIYGGTSSGEIFTCDSNGTLAWTYSTGSGVWSSTAVDQYGKVYAGSTDNRFYALTSTGSLAWSYETGNIIDRSNPTIGPDGRIFTGSRDNRVYAYNPSGTLSWSYDAGQWVISCPAVLDDSHVYIGTGDRFHGVSYLLSLTSAGSFTWSYGTGDRIESAPAVGIDGTIYMSSRDNCVYALTSAGNLSWTYCTGYYVYSSPAIGPDGMIYVGSCDNSFYALTSAGSLSWWYVTEGWVASSPAVGSDGTTYVGSRDNRVYSFTSAGNLLWSYHTGNIERSSPAIGADGRLYVGSNQGIYCFIDPTPVVIPTVTPTPTGTPTPPLTIEPGKLVAGSSFSFIIKLKQSITRSFDYYIVADTQFGPYTLYFGGNVSKGILPLYTDIPGYPAPYEKTVIPNVILPLTMGGKEVTFYTVVVEAGKMPPVSSLSELTADTPYVIMLDKKTVTVAP